MTLQSAPVHIPVMPREVLKSLQLEPGMIVFDGTIGAGGHSAQILPRIRPGGTLIGTDRDPMMLSHASAKLSGDDVFLQRASYTDAAEILQKQGITGVDRVILDLGLSSDQLTDRSRGFGFDAGGPLDMRFCTQEGTAAADLLLKPEQEIADILRQWGEEPAAGAVAAEIVRLRTSGAAITTTAELVDCVMRVAGKNRSPVTRVFQALRIAANDELQIVRHMLEQVLPRILNPGAVVAVISFHSLEDRIVKQTFRSGIPWQPLQDSPLTAQPAEIRINPRSRPAKLRTAKWEPEQ